ncbi:MAG: hypothetical protein EZS28_030171 [Streblomastix strix]|uniref:Tyr recombinase domain-containing protein n=1 Tax=Streblomastix strix TaxID=222440 RepID=A0A5J4UVW9_9EUKA|nr:MAG: hypothetical protein EZS28_030171 [Streblomastix strix]
MKTHGTWEYYLTIGEKKRSNRKLANVELQTKLISILMTICSMRPAEIYEISLRHLVIFEQTDKIDLRLQPKTKSLLHSYKLPKTRDRILCPGATFFDWLKRIDNKHSRSIKDNKLKKLLDVMGIKEKQVHLFRHSAAAQLVVISLDETQVGELLTMVSNKLVGMRCQQSFMGGYAHAVR